MRGCSTAGTCRPAGIYWCCVRQRPPDLDLRPRVPGLPMWLTPLVHQYDRKTFKAACGRVAGCQLSRCALQPAEFARAQPLGFHGSLNCGVAAAGRFTECHALGPLSFIAKSLDFPARSRRRTDVRLGDLGCERQRRPRQFLRVADTPRGNVSLRIEDATR